VKVKSRKSGGISKRKALFSAIGIAIVLLILLVVWLGPQNILERLEKADLFFIGLALVVEIINLFILAFRWHIFINSVSKVDFKTTFMITLAGSATSNITPSGRVGGEPLRVYLLRKLKGVRYGTGFATIIVERIADMLAFLVLAFVAVVYSVFFIRLPPHVILLMILSLCSTASLIIGLWYVTFRKEIKSTTIEAWLSRHEWITKKIPVLNYYKSQLEESVSNYYKQISNIMQKRTWFYSGFIISFVYWTLEIMRAYFLFLAFGEVAHLPVIALAYILSAIIGSLPFGIGGIGLTEGTMIIIYSTSNINTVVAGIVTVFDRLFSYWLVILLGLPLAGYLGIESLEVGKYARLHDSNSKGSKKG